jgi:hypothetical protein
MESSARSSKPSARTETEQNTSPEFAFVFTSANLDKFCNAFHLQMEAPNFRAAREALSELLGNLSFVKVVSIQKSGTAYTGEAVEIFGSKRLGFFDKFGRTRGFLTVGPVTLTQAPYGLDHSSSIPSVGEILVGTLVPNARKSHLSVVLRGWSSDAKPLSELYRIVKFGTKKSEFESRSMLLQPAAFVDQMKVYRDELYMLARIVLWKNLRPCQVLASVQGHCTLKDPATEAELLAAKTSFLSLPAVQFVQLISIKLADPTVLESFEEGLIPIVPSVSSTYAPYAAPADSPAYNPTSPAYNPTSPAYVPYSPKSPSGPPASAASIASPQSPVYCPSSPIT